MRRFLPALLLTVTAALPLRADGPPSPPAAPPRPGDVRAPGLPPQLEGVFIEQHLGEQIPPELMFRDETGQTVRLGDYFGDKPLILVLAYFKCPMLCNQVQSGLVDRLRALRLRVGRDFSVLTVSFDAREGSEQAAAMKESYVGRYGFEGGEQGWHFLTGDQANIDRLTEAVGFRYRYDAEKDEFAHASGITLLTPEGKIARYFMGLSYAPRDLQLSLVEASEGRIGSPVDQLMLYCFAFDGGSGRYTASILGLVRVGGVVTVVALAACILWARRREAKAGRNVTTAG